MSQPRLTSPFVDTAIDVYRECQKIALRYVGHLLPNHPDFDEAVKQGVEEVRKYLAGLPMQQKADFLIGSRGLISQLDKIGLVLLDLMGEEAFNSIMEEQPDGEDSTAERQPGEQGS